MPTTPPFEHAIVIGGSMAGLLTARVLAKHFARVTLVERDPLAAGAAPRKGVPQGRHAHGLLAQGQAILADLFPGLVDELVAAGAITVDVLDDVLWYQPGGYRLRFASGLTGLILSRPLLEEGVRRRVAALPNVTLRAGVEVSSLAADAAGARVTGVALARPDAPDAPWTLPADLVIDAAGRGSHAPAWLRGLGYEPPREERIDVDVSYTTRLFRRVPGALAGAQLVLVQPTPPRERSIGVLFPIEGDRWIVTLGGWLGERAPVDLAGFRAFAGRLPVPDIHRVIADAEPLDDGAVYRFPANLRRRYEHLARVPEGYAVLGDALCSFNPVYGQGMTAGALQALALDHCLTAAAAGGSLIGLPRRFYRRAAAFVDVPWQMAAGADFAYPEVGGRRGHGTALFNRYMDRVQRAATQDAAVCRTLVEVTNLLAPPSRLLAPDMVWRVARATVPSRRAARPAVHVGMAAGAPRHAPRG